MAAITTIIAGASLALAAGGAYMNYRQQRSAARAASEALDEQKKIQAEQEAANRQAQQIEARQQVREARIRRAQILQASENTGTAMSSGALGATGSIWTQLSTNVGANRGAIDRAGRISSYNQRIADLQSSAAQSNLDASVSTGFSNLGSSIFAQAGGWGTLGKAFNSSGISARSGNVSGGNLNNPSAFNSAFSFKF